MLFAVRLRSCLVFSNYTVPLLVLLLFCENVLMIWSNAAAKTERKIGESLVARICLHCVEKQEGPRRIRQQHEQ